MFVWLYAGWGKDVAVDIQTYDAVTSPGPDMGDHETKTFLRSDLHYLLRRKTMGEKLRQFEHSTVDKEP